MDIPRPELRRKKIIRQSLIGGGVLVLAVILSAWIATLEKAVPSVPRSSVWVDTVRQGELLRQVRGTGTLVPREIRWIVAQTDGRVERILVRPGAIVDEQTILVEMSNNDLLQQRDEARFALEAAEAEFADAKLQLKSQQLDKRAAVGVARAEYESARLQAEAERDLAKQGVVPEIQYKRSLLLEEQLKLRLDIENERLDQFAGLMEAQISSQRSRLELSQNALARREEQVRTLEVRAGLGGVLQELLIEVGQRVAIGANIARVARPDELQAELRVPETQARDVQVGQQVAVDTRNGVVAGRVARIDPAVQEGTVQVDVEITGELPRGARPDLSVDGTIEIERLDNVVYTGRPVYGQPDSTIGLFKLVDGGRYALRVPVQIGRTSVNAVEIKQGLAPGDEVILSDTTAWGDYDKLRLD